MKASATEKSAAYELIWSLDATSPGDGSNERVLKLEYQITAFEELYIGDRLWDDDAQKRRIPDPFGVYRFVQNGSLRLVFAPAPHAPNIKIANTYQPLYSRVLAGETLRKAVQIKLPVDEYSSLERDVGAPTVLEEVSRVFFVLSYRLRSTMDRAPGPPLTETVEEAGYLVPGPKELIISGMQVEPLPVKRRTGYTARFPLPGEPGPEPIPLELLR
jgi:hypothetical protein